MSEQQVFVVPGGRVVHLTTRCTHIKKAQGQFEQKSLLRVKVECGGEPRICELCRGIVKKAVGRR